MPLPLLPLIPLVASLVPEAVKWLAGDSAGKVAEKVAAVAVETFGTSDPDTIERAVAADPNLALQFKMAVLAAQAASEKEETARMMAQLADVQSARTQTVELAKAGSPIAWGAAVCSVLVIGGFTLILYFVLSKEIPEGSREAAIYALGQLGGMATAAVAYWVGSSAGSAQKTGALETLARKR